MSEPFTQWLQATPFAMAISQDWFPWVESTHVVCLALVAGTLFMVDTRLMGLTLVNLRVTHVAERLLPWTWGAFIGAAITGSTMFIAGATHYTGNAPFLIKMGLLVLAGINMLYFQFVTYRDVARWDSGRPTRAARAAGAVSLLLWCLIIGFGRWVGFV